MSITTLSPTPPAEGDTPSIFPSLDPAVRMTPTGLILQGDLPFERWRELCRALPRVGDAVKWAIGDAVHYGQVRYGGRYEEAMAATGLDYQSIGDLAWVARTFEFSRRRENCPWWIHREVAPLSVELQEQWLDYAQHELPTRAQMRALLHQQDTQEPLLTPQAQPPAAQGPAPGKQPTNAPVPDPDPAQQQSQTNAAQAPNRQDALAPRDGALERQSLVADPAQQEAPSPTPAAIPETRILWRVVHLGFYGNYRFEIAELPGRDGTFYQMRLNGEIMATRHRLAKAMQDAEDFAQQCTLDPQAREGRA